MKVGLISIIVGLTSGIGNACPATSGACTASEAAYVEQNLQSAETWSQFSRFYFLHQKCDVNALKYLFTQQIAHLTANDRGMLDLSKMLAKQPQLRPIVLKHLKSEAVTSNHREQILDALAICRVNQKVICREVKKMVDTF